MIPNTTGNTSGCNPISSNCVVWQGPNLECINVCNGDTISIIIAKMAEYICALSDITATIDISLIDQSCLVTDPETEDILTLLQNMINAICNNTDNLVDLWEFIESLGIEDEEGNPLGPIGPLGPIAGSVSNTGGSSNAMASMPDVKLPETFRDAKGYNNNQGIVIYSSDSPNKPIETMKFWDNNNPKGYWEKEGDTTIYYYGWADFVSKKLSCLLKDHDCSPQGRQASSNGTTAVVDNNTVRDLPVIKQLQSKLIRIERKSTAVYTPPTVIATSTGKLGQRMEMNKLLSAIDKDYAALKRALGSTADILKASRGQCINLAGQDRLNGTGKYSSLPGWHMAPSSLAQSIDNNWKVLCDIRSAVSDLQSTVSPSACTGFIYDPKLKLIKDGTGAVSGINIDFRGMTIPSGFYDCNKAKGTKITVEDSSLNSMVSYANVSELQNSKTGFNVGNMSNVLDITSNFKIKIDFCFTDGSNECGRIMEFTLENTSGCPTITLTTTGETSIEYSVSGLSTTSKSTYEIIVEDSLGSVISKQTIKEPTTASTTGKAANLIAGTTYNIYNKTTTLAGNVATCGKTEFTTSAASCSTVVKASTEYASKIADVGITKTTIAKYTDGATTTAWIFGLDASDAKTPIVYKGTDSSVTAGTDQKFYVYSDSISDNPTTSISCGNVTYAAEGMTTLLSPEENGWQYAGAITANGNTTYYVYALVNSANKSIDKVVFCCDCKPSYVRPIYNTDDTSSDYVGYTSDRTAWYASKTKDLRIPINIVGYSEQTTPITWNATSILGGTTKFSLPTDSDYDSNLKGDVQLVYSPNVARPTAGVDSVEVYAKTDCTTGNPGNRTVNTVTIPIVDAVPIPNKDTDITVFIDTNVFSEDEAVIIKDQIDDLKTFIQTNCTEWTGTVNYIPVTGSNSGDYLQYTKAMVDMKNGATGSVTVASGYTTVKSLPAYWGASSTAAVPTTVYMICFIGDVNGSGTYGSNSISNGWNSPAQPTASYQTNYDELLDILWVNGALRSTWGLTAVGGSAITHKQFELTQILIPTVSGSQDNSSGAVLQTIGAVTGTTLSTTGYKGLASGSTKNPIDISGYLGPNASLPVPYTGTTAGGANTISGLYNYGFRVMPFIDKSILTADINEYSSSKHEKQLGAALKRITEIDLSGNSLLDDRSCPTGTDTGKVMTGTLDGTDVTSYGFNAGANSCRNAGIAAITIGNCISIYNSTGIEFDTSVKAYKSKQGANTATASDELHDGRWYAQHGPSAKDSIRRVAKYDADASSGGYWESIQNVGDATCV